MTEPLVSIVMPLYNAEQFVGEAVDSVLVQSHTNWELIIVDDCSTDASADIVRSYSDPRIRVLQHDCNRGAASARSTALSRAAGDYIAFFDSDDVWLVNKLERQLEFMADAGAAMCFTSYETIEEDGAHRNYVRVPAQIDYKGFLKNTITCSHTIAFDMAQISKDWLMAPTGKCYDFPEDLAVWLGVLKRGFCAYGLDEVLAKNRKRSGSRSADKLKAVRRTWNQYRQGEGMGVPYSAYCLFWQLYHAVLKRL